MIPDKNSDWLRHMMQDYAQTVGESAQSGASGAEIPPDLDRFCKKLIRCAPVKPRKRHPLRPAVLAAAILAVLLAGVIAVQAAGVNLFGTQVEWTDGVLSVLPELEIGRTYADREAVPGSTLDAALTELGLPRILAPSRLPAGYMLRELKITAEEYAQGVYACYAKGADSLFIGISRIDGTTDPFRAEKDAGAPEMYTTRQNRTFMIFSNMGQWTGRWSDGSSYTVSLSGFQTKEMLIQTIDSMEE